MQWIFFGFFLLILIIFWRINIPRTETPKYKIMKKQGSIEVREYDSLIVAETEVEGEREEAIRQGFRRIASYIFGKNCSSEKIRMTAPVCQQSIQKIDMNGGLLEKGLNAVWRVRFIMPRKYTLSTIPQPQDDRVQLKQIDLARVVAIRFSGTPNAATLEAKSSLLNQFLQKEGLVPISAPVYAFYNPPWTLPPLRRNEIWIEIQAK